MRTLRKICDTVSDLVDEVGKHLEKMQINKQWAARNEELHLSPLISSSGSFHWTAHATCLRGKTATEGQEAGLAIFDTSKIKASGVPLWRVLDLLSDNPDDYFLRSEFIGAASLGDFKKRFLSSLEPLIVD